MNKSNKGSVCPSSDVTMNGAQVVAVVTQNSTGPRLNFLPAPYPVTAEILSLASADRLGEVLRVSARCIEEGCSHFKDSQCSLIKKAVRLLKIETAGESSDVPRCHIRSSCVWWKQEGKDACVRCSFIITKPRGVAPDVLSMDNHSELQ